MPGFGNEGFIIARFTIKADGTTGDVELVGGFGADNPFMQRPLVESIEKWTYTPGTVNGQPADFLNQEIVIRRKVSETLASSPDFQEEYAKLDAQVKEQEYAAAIRRIQGSLRDHVHTVLDYAASQYTLSRILVQMNEPFGALDAVKRTTMYSLNMAGEREYMLTPDLLEGALRQQLVLASSLRQDGEVLRTWQILDELYDVPADDRIHEIVTASQARVDSTEPLPALAKILDGAKLMTYRPVHRIFTVTDVKGELESVTARCDHRNLELEFQADVEWRLPPSLGSCVLDFAGDENTTFTIYEFKE